MGKYKLGEKTMKFLKRYGKEKNNSSFTHQSDLKNQSLKFYNNNKIKIEETISDNSRKDNI